MPEPLITLERQLAALAEAVEAYTTNQKPYTFDRMEQEMHRAFYILKGSPE